MESSHLVCIGKAKCTGLRGLCSISPNCFFLLNRFSFCFGCFQLLEHMLRPLAKIYPMEWRSVLVDFGTPPTEHLFIRVRNQSFCTVFCLEVCCNDCRIIGFSAFCIAQSSDPLWTKLDCPTLRPIFLHRYLDVYTKKGQCNCSQTILILQQPSA